MVVGVLLLRRTWNFLVRAVYPALLQRSGVAPLHQRQGEGIPQAGDGSPVPRQDPPADSVASHPDQCPDDRAGLCPDRSRLGLLHHGHRSAQVHERCAALLDQGQRVVLVAAVPADVDRGSVDGSAK
uniref:(northern house mosquito) hypothetical protein n=1 Tax=Culex pipiens TaxID=7175 RepID=A0A8D8G603_CULPI